MSDAEEATVAITIDSDADDTSIEQHYLLKGWTKEEKFNLLQGLKAYGSNCIEEISFIVPGKTEKQIEDAINFYKTKATKSLASVVEAKKKKSQSSSSSTNKSAPLSSWAKILTDTFPYKDLQTETATALRFIANYENIPVASCTGNINFRDLYLTMADAIEGKDLSKDIDILVIMQKCLLETALDSRSFIMQSNIQCFLDSIKLRQDRHIFTRPTTSSEMATLQHLISQRSYNPFEVPEEYLRPSKKNFHNPFKVLEEHVGPTENLPIESDNLP